MPEFSLPHDHGAHQHEEEVRRVLADDARFSAVAELFRSLGDPTRVRIFWLLSHREECVINIAAMLDMSPPYRTICARSPRTGFSRAGVTARRSITARPTPCRGSCCMRS